jgi:hypothetical protein
VMKYIKKQIWNLKENSEEEEIQSQEEGFF